MRRLAIIFGLLAVMTAAMVAADVLGAAWLAYVALGALLLLAFLNLVGKPR